MWLQISYPGCNCQTMNQLQLMTPFQMNTSLLSLQRVPGLLILPTTWSHASSLLTYHLVDIGSWWALVDSILGLMVSSFAPALTTSCADVYLRRMSLTFFELVILNHVEDTLLLREPLRKFSLLGIIGLQFIRIVSSMFIIVISASGWVILHTLMRCCYTLSYLWNPSRSGALIS